MATTNATLAGIALAVLAAAPVEAASNVIHVRVKYSGSAVTRDADPNHDGIKPALGILTCQSNLGRCTAQGIGEATMVGPGTCPNGHPGLKLAVIPGTGHGFTRFEKSGDMLFDEVVSETACYDTTTGILYKSGTNRITGGTGRFEGATGQTDFQGTQWLLYIDGDGNAFAAQTGTSTGTVVLRHQP